MIGWEDRKEEELPEKQHRQEAEVCLQNPPPPPSLGGLCVGVAVCVACVCMRYV